MLFKSTPRKKGGTILLICRIDLKKIQELEKKFKWKKPKTCPGCGGTRLWGHGYVLRYFFGYDNGLWMKRWRCPDCKGVHSCRPEAYLPGMQYPRKIQRKSLEAKLAGSIFLSTISRQSQQYWYKTFQRLCLETGNFNDPLEFHQKNIALGQLRVSKRRIYRDSWPHAVDPYLPFAVTVRNTLFKLE